MQNKLDDKTKSTLINKALEARTHAYSPYSKFCVGAALLCADGSIYQGANSDNSAYGTTICAERLAFPKAVYDGHRKFIAIAIVGGPAGCKDEDLSYCPPCGQCRQYMSEFCDDDFYVLLSKGTDNIKAIPFGEIMPYKFSSDNLK